MLLPHESLFSDPLQSNSLGLRWGDVVLILPKALSLHTRQARGAIGFANVQWANYQFKPYLTKQTVCMKSKVQKSMVVEETLIWNIAVKVHLTLLLDVNQNDNWPSHSNKGTRDNIFTD